MAAVFQWDFDVNVCVRVNVGGALWVALQIEDGCCRSKICASNDVSEEVVKHHSGNSGEWMEFDGDFCPGELASMAWFIWRTQLNH